MKRAKLIKTALISGVALAILIGCGGGGSTKSLSQATGKSWQGAKIIDNDFNKSAYWPSLAVNSKGDIVASWIQNDQYNRNKVWLRKYYGENWSEADSEVKPNNHPAAFPPSVSIDNNKKILVTWLQYQNNKFIPKARFYDGNSWNPNGNTYDINYGNTSSYPVKLVTTDKKVVAVWAQKINNKYSIIAKVFDKDNKTWTSHKTISNTNFDNKFYYEVTKLNDNKLIIVWEDKDSSNHIDIYAGVYKIDDLSLVKAPQRIDDDTPDARTPTIASNGEGKSILLWRQDYSIYASIFDGSNWSNPQPIENSPKFAMNPYIAYDKISKKFAAIWTQKNDNNKYVIYTRFYNSGSWEDIKVLDNSSQYDSNNPKIAFDSEGNAIAIWLKQNNNNEFDLVAKRFDGSSWGDTEILDNQPASVYSHSIAFDQNDNAVVIWRQIKGNSGKYRIFANTLE